MATMIKKIFIISVVTVFICGSSIPFAYAEEGAKIGYVDFRRTFYENDKVKAEEEALRDYEDEQQEKQMEMIEEITQLRDEAELLSDDTKDRKRAEIKKKINELQNFENEVRKKLQTKKNDTYREIADDIQKVVDEVGKNGEYDYILDSRSIIYTSKDFDITDEVIEKLKKKK